MKGHERTTILLARHGECRGNVEGLFRGRVDFPLNERGLRQAAELGSALRPYSPEAVMTSPLLRAKDTARAIAGACSIRVEEDEGFNNISLGIWEGQPKTEIAERYPRAVENLAGKPRAPRRGRGGISRRCSEALHGGPRPGGGEIPGEDLRRSDPQDGHQAPSRGVPRYSLALFLEGPHGHGVLLHSRPRRPPRLFPLLAEQDGPPFRLHHRMGVKAIP